MLVGSNETSFDGDVTVNSNLYFERAKNKTRIESAGGDFRFHSNQLQRMVITEGGRLGIGTNTPLETLAVQGRIHISDGTSPGDTTNRLYSVSGDLYWNGVDVNTGGSIPTVTTKGDVLTYDTGEARLAVGTNGQFLVADSAEATGLKWSSNTATLPQTTKGDISTYDTGNARLPVGTNGQVLEADSGQGTGLKWANKYSNPLTTKGDINVYDSAETRLGVGTNGQYLQADSGESTGLKWVTATASTPLTTKGDLLMYDTGDNRLSVGTQGQVLSVDSGEASGLKWVGATSDLWTDNSGNIYYTTGKVGIGINSPSQQLHIHNAVAVSNSKIKFSNVESTNGTEFGINGSSGHFQFKNRDAKDIEFYTNDVKRMIIKSSGNIGLNVTSPTEILEMDGVMKMRNQTIAPTSTLNKLYSINGTLFWNGVDLLIGGNNNNVWSQTGNNIYYTTGSVGIGTNTPDSTSALNITTLNKSAINFGGDCIDTTNPLGSYYGKVMVNVEGVGRKWIPLYNDDPLNEVDLTDVTYSYSTQNPGDVVEFENGSYDKIKITISCSGTEANPIIFKAKTNGSVTFKNQIYINVTGDWIIINGITFFNASNHSGGDGKNIFKVTGDDFRITNCEFDGYVENAPNEKYVRVDGKRPRIDHNWFHNQVGSGALVAINRVNDDLAVYACIDSNIFDDRADGGGGNGYEIIRLGTSSESNSMSISDGKMMVYNNQFNACDGEIEVISVKCGACIIKTNTLFNCKGTITLRHGNGSFVYSNKIDGNNKNQSGGVRVIGRNHKVFKNYILNLDGNEKIRVGISLNAGYDNEATEDTINIPLDQGEKDLLSGYFQVDNTEVYSNYMKDVETCFTMGGMSKNDLDLKAINSNIHDNICKGTYGFRSDTSKALGETNTTYTNNVFEVTTLDHGADAGIIEQTADFIDLNPVDYGVQGNDFGITNVDPLTNGLGNLQTHYDDMITNMPL